MKSLTIPLATIVILGAALPLSASNIDPLPEPPPWPFDHYVPASTRIQIGIQGGYNATSVNAESGDAVELKGSIIEGHDIDSAAIGAFARVTHHTSDGFFTGLQLGVAFDKGAAHGNERINSPVSSTYLNVSHRVDTDMVVDGLIRTGVDFGTFRPYIGGGVSVMRAKSGLQYSRVNTGLGSREDAADVEQKWLWGYKLVSGIEIPIGSGPIIAQVEGFYADYEKTTFRHDVAPLGGGMKQTSVNPEQ